MQETADIIAQMVAKAKASNLTNQKWADQSGASKSTVDKIVRGETLNPSFQTVMDMAAVVGITIFTPAEELDSTGARPKDPVYEDRIARMRAHYNGLLAEKDRHLEEKDKAIIFAGKIIGGLLLVDFLMVVSLILFVLL